MEWFLFVFFFFQSCTAVLGEAVVFRVVGWCSEWHYAVVLESNHGVVFRMALTNGTEGFASGVCC